MPKSLRLPFNPAWVKKDVWIVGPNDTGYPGGFPRGLINKIKRNWWGRKRLWLCSGSVSDGVTIDLNRDVHPIVQGDVQYLPFKDETFDFVMADPPYSEAEAKELYNLPYPSPTRLLIEGWRVLEYGGHLLFLHRLIPSDSHIPFRRQMIAIIGIGITAAWSNIRALTVFRKRHPIELWGEDGTMVQETP